MAGFVFQRWLHPARRPSRFPGPSDGQFRVHCWAKLDAIASRGGVVLAVDAQSPERPELHVTADDTIWTHYRSGDTRHCLAKHTLRLEILSGGFSPAGMYIDCLQVEKAK